jgi:hypothetical protein
MWYHRNVGGERCPIVDTFWQTETGGHMITPLPGATPLVPGSCTLPLPGIMAAIVGETGKDIRNRSGGRLVVRGIPAAGWWAGGSRRLARLSAAGSAVCASSHAGGEPTVQLSARLFNCCGDCCPAVRPGVLRPAPCGRFVWAVGRCSRGCARAGVLSASARAGVLSACSAFDVRLLPSAVHRIGVLFGGSLAALARYAAPLARSLPSPNKPPPLARFAARRGQDWQPRAAGEQQPSAALLDRPGLFDGLLG